MPDWITIGIAVFVAWFIIDQTARIYLMYAPSEDYKEGQTEDPDRSYRQEKEAEVVAFLSQYRVGRWLLKQRDK